MMRMRLQSGTFVLNIQGNGSYVHSTYRDFIKTELNTITSCKYRSWSLEICHIEFYVYDYPRFWAFPS